MRPRILGRLSLAVPILVFLLAVITAFEIRVTGRLSSEISIDFFIDHILSIVGISSGEHAGVAEAAGGVALRMGVVFLAVHGPYDPYQRLGADMGKYLALGVSLNRGEESGPTGFHSVCDPNLQRTC